MGNTAKKLLSLLAALVSALPVVVLVVFYAYVARARFAVGYWPQQYQPESWSMGFYLHYEILRPWFLVLRLGWLPAIAAVVDLSVWAVIRRFPRWSFAILAISSACVYTTVFADPGGFLTWFLD
jgi:hypothetical protein